MADTLQVPRLAFIKPLKFVVTRMSSAEWVVSSGMEPAVNAGAVLGIIQFSAGRFEVTKVGGPRIEFRTCQDLDEAVAVLSAPLHNGLSVGGARMPSRSAL